jgi:hypothetical protein
MLSQNEPGFSHVFASIYGWQADRLGGFFL